MDFTFKKKVFYRYFSTEKVLKTSVCVQPQKILDGVVELVTVNGYPFSILESSGFIRAFSSVLTGCGLVLNNHNIKNHIRERSVAVQNKIRSFKNHLISLKLDCVTRLDRSFIGINMQIIDAGTIKIFNLCTMELTQRHTGENLKKMILKSLTKFEITADNIYTVTTDSGANVLKAVELLRPVFKQSNREAIDIDEPSDDDDNDIMDDLPDEANKKLVNSILGLNWAELKITSKQFHQ